MTGCESEDLGERLRRLLRALQGRADERGERAIEALHVLGGLARHPVSVGAESETRKSAVEHTAGVVDLSVAHEMKAVGGHPHSLRGAFCEVAERGLPLR